MCLKCNVCHLIHLCIGVSSELMMVHCDGGSQVNTFLEDGIVNTSATSSVGVVALYHVQLHTL